MRKRILTAAATVVLASTGTVAVTTDASAATVQAGTPYVLVNRNSGKALDVYNLATTDGAAINQYTRNDGAWQQWKFLDA
ncbi:RICIN domain-containing protein, partial [Actinoplanes aureus]